MMINDIKLACKMFKYGIQGKSLGLLFVIFMGLGIVMEVFATSLPGGNPSGTVQRRPVLPFFANMSM